MTNNQSDSIEYINRVVNEKLVNYDIKAIIADTRVSTVYDAFEKGTGRHVIIKTIKPGVFNGAAGKSLARRLQSQIQTVHQCSHFNIQNISDYAVEDDFVFFALEYVEGVSFSKFINENVALRLQDIVIILLQILNALKYTHDKGVIHADIHPARVILLRGQKIKLRYFDLDSIFTSTKNERESERYLYLAPEQLAGKPADERSDLYSVGMILLELISRSVAQGNKKSIIRAHAYRDDEKALMKLIRTRVPAEFQEVVSQALMPMPQHRFPTAGAFSSALLNIYKSFIVAHEQVETPEPVNEAQAVPDEVMTVANTDSSPNNVDRQQPVDSPKMSYTLDWNPKVLLAIIEKLAEHVGPVAEVLVTEASEEYSEASALIKALAENVSNEMDRGDFVKLATRACNHIERHRVDPSADTNNASASRTTSSNPDLEAMLGDMSELTEELAGYIGPIAPYLIETTLADAKSAKEFYRLLADHIPDIADRSRFIDKRIMS